jgi:N-acetylneuraminate synthase
MKTYIIAEAGVNHNGSFDLAKKLIETAAKCGADAVKFQTFNAKKLTTSRAKKAEYQNENDTESLTQQDMLKKLELTNEEFISLSYECKKQGIDFLTTCFDEASLEIICRETSPKFLKIGSGDLTNLPLIVAHARKQHDIILSTGMATLSEVEDALAALAFGYLSDENDEPKSFISLKQEFFTAENLEKIKNKVTILHCVTDYPAKPEDLNLDAIKQLSSSYKLRVGYSDHSLGIEACCASVALGASCLEKHITLDKRMSGPDHAASASPDEFSELVRSIRNLEKALIPKIKAPTERERKNINVARKYIVANEDIDKGTIFTKENLTIKRSLYGVSPSLYWDYLGKVAKISYKCDENI